MGYATYLFVRRASRPTVWFFLSGSLSVPLMLLLLDLVRDGQAAATAGYLMPAHLGALIALAFFLSVVASAPATNPATHPSRR